MYVLHLQNVLAGALYGPVYGVPLVCVLTSIGASCCYLLSRFILKDIVTSYFNKQLSLVQKKVCECVCVRGVCVRAWCVCVCVRAWCVCVCACVVCVRVCVVCVCVCMHVCICTYLPVCLSVCVLQIEDQSHSLLYIMISLRLVPVTPNWLLNILSPVLGVPLPLFFVSVLTGNVCTCMYVPFYVCV